MTFENTVQELLDRISKDYKGLIPGFEEAVQGTTIFKERQQCQSLKKLLDENTPVMRDLERKCHMLDCLSKIILDYTYHLENKLSEADFSTATAEKDVNEIIEYMSIPERLSLELSTQPEDPKGVLDKEICECLYWRRGALLYMYCCTKYGGDGSSIHEKEQFLKYLADGVGFFENMLTTRSPVQMDNAEVKPEQEDLIRLLSEGIFTDTHVLALMYSGEMCYWYNQLADKAASNETQFNAKKTGTSMLKKYLDIVQGPLKAHQWNTARAEEIMKLLS